MRCFIIKEFPYSENGITSKTAEKGSKANIPEALVKGLKAGGYLSPIDQNERETKVIEAAPETGDAVQIPDGWRDLKYHDLKALANSVSDEFVRTKDDCIAAIELYIES